MIATCEGYADASTCPPPDAPTGPLPLTGVEAVGIALIGLAVALSGLVLRRASRWAGGS